MISNRDISLIQFQGEIFLDLSILFGTWRHAIHRRKSAPRSSQRVLKSRRKKSSIKPIGQGIEIIVGMLQRTFVGQNSDEPLAYAIIIYMSLMFSDDT